MEKGQQFFGFIKESLVCLFVMSITSPSGRGLLKAFF